MQIALLGIDNALVDYSHTVLSGPVCKLAAGFSEAAAVAGKNEVTMEKITVKIIELLATFFVEQS